MLAKGTGRPIEPGRGVEPTMFATMTGLSVWPNPSKISLPVCFFQNSNRSGLSASPAVVKRLTDDRS